MIIKIADIVLFKHDRILLVQQKKPRVYGSWSLPGGHIEKNESPEAAIIREVKEELGITLAGLDAAKKIEHTEGKTDEGIIAVFTFIMPYPSAELVLQTDELIGSGWFNLGELQQLSFSLRSPWIVDMTYWIS